MMRVLFSAPFLMFSALPAVAQQYHDAGQQYPLTSFDELLGDWVNSQGSQVNIDQSGRVSTYVGSNGLSGRVAVGVTPGGGNFSFAGKIDNHNYQCSYNVIFTDSGSSSVWSPVDEIGTHHCPRGVFVRSH